MATMTYKEAVIQAMQELSCDSRVLFLGQNVCYPGHVVYETLEAIPAERKIEMPVAEAMQMGICTGLALAGYVPVCIFPRIDFMLLAIDQLVNHLDKLTLMSCGQFQPHVIIRTMLGNTEPLHPGPQHSQDHTLAFKALLRYTRVWNPVRPSDVLTAYRCALQYPLSHLVVEQAYR